MNGRLAGLGGSRSEIDEWWELDPDICGAYPYGGADGGTGADGGAGAATLECVCIYLRPGSEVNECWELDPDISGAEGCVACPYGGTNAGTGADAGAGTATLGGGRVD